MSHQKPPETLILGRVKNEWPVAAFTSEAHALHWVAEDPAQRVLWRVQVINAVALEYVPPGEPSLREVRP